jgi:hypothetical protein
MRKLFLIIFVFSCFFIQSYAQVQISIDCQDNWGPGRFNLATYTINISNAEGFMRFTQDLPVGFTVVKDSSGEGDFNWSNDQLNIVWMKLPESHLITFSCYYKPDQPMNGDFTLNGRLVYIADRETRESFQMKEKKINIGGSNGLLPEELKTNTGVLSETKMEKKAVNQDYTQKNVIVFRVQVSISSTNISANELKRELGIDSKEGVTIVRSGKMFKYQLGSFADYDAANRLLKQLIDKGIKDAFIVAYNGKEQIPVEKTMSPGK